MTCLECPYMRQGSSFDGKHLYCLKYDVWTNLLDPRFIGKCLDDYKHLKVTNTTEEEQEDTNDTKEEIICEQLRLELW